jgi:hypothetical protein
MMEEFMNIELERIIERKLLWSDRGTIPPFAGRDWGQPWKLSYLLRIISMDQYEVSRNMTAHVWVTAKMQWMYVSENVLVVGYGLPSCGRKPQYGVMHSRHPSPFCTSFLEQHSYYIATCREVRVTKITGSRSDEWIYWCSLTITLNSDFSESESESHVTTDGQPASLSWNKAPIWGLRPDLDYCLTVAGLLVWGALSDERMGLPFAFATGPRQRSHFRVRVP